MEYCGYVVESFDKCNPVCVQSVVALVYYFYLLTGSLMCAALGLQDGAI